jgi:D-arabinose 1-dehydrogenase-like Zn-dependent alcohol dehydrogenase
MHCERHQFYGLTRDGGFADYVLVDERSLMPLPDGVEPAAVAPHADAGLTAYHAVKRLLPRLTPGRPRRDRRRRRRPHRAAAPEGARRRLGDRDRHRRAPARLARELGADEVLADTGRRARGDERSRRRRDHGLRRHRRHSQPRASTRSRGAGSTRRIGYGGTITVPSVAMVVGETAIAGNLVGNWIDLWELLQLQARGDVTLRTETHPLEAVNDVLDRLARARSPAAPCWFPSYPRPNERP